MLLIKHSVYVASSLSSFYFPSYKFMPVMWWYVMICHVMWFYVMLCLADHKYNDISIFYIVDFVLSTYHWKENLFPGISFTKLKKTKVQTTIASKPLI